MHCKVKWKKRLLIVLLNWLRNYQNLHLISFSECAVTIIQPFGVITSPGFPQFYRNGIDCTWNIQLLIGQLIQFNFLHLDIPDYSSCGWDTFASDIFPTQLMVDFSHATKFFWYQGWFIENLWWRFKCITNVGWYIMDILWWFLATKPNIFKQQTLLPFFF